MPLKRTIAVFDIGKTNKKFILFDESYRGIYEDEIRLGETVDEDGDACEDIDALRQWVIHTLKHHLKKRETDIVAVNFSAYGASFIHLGKDELPLTPLYNYLKPYPDKLLDSFYARYGGPQHFARATASPLLGSLNSGLQIYRIKTQQPDLFASIQYSLHLPQYLSSLVSKTFVTEMTSVGCHTALWDFRESRYHEWVKKEGITKIFPAIVQSGHATKCNWFGKDLITGVGLHDSSSALIPYLLQCKDPFVLLSSGTWNISLNPFNQAPLTENELAHDCLCYIDYQGKPVKASRLFAGFEHEHMLDRLASHFQVSRNYYETVQANRKIISGFSTPDAGDSVTVPSEFENYEFAYHHFMHSLVSRQWKALRLVMPDDGIKNIYVDGGFSRNRLFMELMGKYFPNQKVYRAEISRASATGAALVLHHQWNHNPIPLDLVQLERNS